MKRKLPVLAGLAATLGLAAVAAGPAVAERGSYNNWHVHDGGSGVDANGLAHRGSRSSRPSSRRETSPPTSRTRRTVRTRRIS